MSKFDLVYKEALAHVLSTGVKTKNKRTGSIMLETHGYSFNYDMNILPRLFIRKTWISSAAAELAWFLSGTKDASWVNSKTKIWKDFTDQDGNIPTAYGYRWSHLWGYDQINNILTKLALDPTSRQQVLLTWDPMNDNRVDSKNIPCPFVYVVNIIDNKLNLHLTVRSNDTWLGLPYDVMTACLLGRALANSLDIDLGKLHYSVANLHLYENQFELAQEACNMEILHDVSTPNESLKTVLGIRANMDEYHKSFKHLDDYEFSGWKPKVNVVK